MTLRTVLQAVDRLCESELDDRRLRAQVVERLHELIDFRWYVWLMTDPVTCVGGAPLAAVPDLAELPLLIRLKYRTETNRWTTLPRAQAVGLVAGGPPSRSAVWEGVQRRHGVTDVLSLVLRDVYGCWGFLDLWRTDAEFDRDDAALLSTLAAPLTQASRRAVAATFDAAPGPVPAHGPGVLLLSADLVPTSRTPATDDLLRTLLPPGAEHGSAAPVPAAALNVAAQLLAIEEGVDSHPAVARVHLAGGRWLTVRAARLDDRDGDIVVTFEPTTSEDRADLFARAAGLSEREAQLLRRLLAGERTRELAASLHISEHTVQDHLKSIFTKTGTRTRPGLAARALGVAR